MSNFKPYGVPDIYVADKETKERIVKELEWIIELIQNPIAGYPFFNLMSYGEHAQMETEMENDRSDMLVRVFVGVTYEG